MNRSSAQPAQRLRAILRRIDGRGYRAYKDIEGTYTFDHYVLVVDHAQADPFAALSRVRVQVDQRVAGYPAHCLASRSRTVALGDYLARCFCSACRGEVPASGTGSSGRIQMAEPGQEILERTSVVILSNAVEARFCMGLPAFGRRVAAKAAEQMFFQALPRIIGSSLLYRSLDAAVLGRHLDTAEDADSLRVQCVHRGLVAFVADGSVLPRASGVDSRPLRDRSAVKFSAPDSMRVQIEVTHRGPVSGMAVRRGVTLIVGGGYHGKSTLLKAIESGVYNHVPGDGREMVVADPGVLKVRAEDGRRVEKVNISAFIGRLPNGTSTTSFSTEDASGSTSQAASIVEGVEAGATALLMDEDTSATNFMIRDRRMQALIERRHEPITPFIDQVRCLYDKHGISTILVLGGSGDYLDVADCVVAMNAYQPVDLTERARHIAADMPTQRVSEARDEIGPSNRRVVLAESVSARKGRKEASVAARGMRTISFGVETIDLMGAEQIVDVAQTRALGDALVYARRYMADTALRDVIERVAADIRRQGLGCIGRYATGEYALFRALELGLSLNRLRSLRVRTEAQRT